MSLYKKEQHFWPLGPGKAQLEYGPISMTLEAWQGDTPLDALLSKGAWHVANCLVDLSTNLSKLKQPWQTYSSDEFSGLAFTLWEAVSKTKDPDLTPMAAVAGCMADMAADFLLQEGATKVIVNNGGDIALRLLGDERACVGISSLETGQLLKTLSLTAKDQVGGICTSGFGGRSFTLGVAEAVTVLAKTASTADAFATYLANQTTVDAPCIKRTLAGEIDPFSDIAHLAVTTQVGTLTQAEIHIALTNFSKAAEVAHFHSHIIKSYAYIKGQEKVGK